MNRLSSAHETSVKHNPPAHAGAQPEFIEHHRAIHSREKFRAPLNMFALNKYTSGQRKTVQNHDVGSSWRFGKDVWVPSRVTLIPAHKLARRIDSTIGTSLAKKNARLPRKQSPAPVVSTARTAFSTGTNVCPSKETCKLPFSPIVTKTWPTPLNER